jgi:signal transduction histidine kinase
MQRTRRLIRLVEDLVLVAKETSGGISVSPAEIDVGQTIAGVVADLDHLGAHRVRVEVAPDLSAWADSDRLAQVLTNLIRNALQYSEPGSAIEVVASAAPDEVRIAVSDHGPGIPAEMLPGLFDRFGERDTGQAGLGVGLWIVRELLAAMDGSVRVEANPNGGSTFHVTVPATAPTSQEQDAAS